MTRTLTRVLAPVALVVAVVIGWADPAAAHARLVSTSPPSGSVLRESPAEVRLAFNESIDLVDGGLRLIAAVGGEIELGEIDHSDPSAIVAAVPDLDEGTYVVGWKALSADSHPISGAFSFTVGSAPPASAELLASVLAGGEAPAAASRALTGGRWASYLGIAVLLGVVSVAGLMAPALLDGGRVRRVLGAAWLAAVVGNVVMVVAQGSVLRGGGHWVDPSAWSDVVATRAGLWWAVRLAMVVVAAVVVARPRLVHRSPLAVDLFGVLLLVVVALGGHAVTGRWVALGVAATVAHLVAMVAWVGVLVVLALLVPRSELVDMARRLSPVALGAVAVLVASGALNGVRQVGDLDALTSTGFGKLLVAKVVGVLLILVLAAESRFVLRSATEGGDAGEGGESGPSSALGALRRTVPAELIGVVLVLVLTAALVNRPPGRDEVTGPSTATMVRDDRTAQVVVEPARAGTPAVLHATITTPRGSLDAPDEMTLSVSLEAEGLGTIEIPLTPSGPNHAVANEVVFPLAGDWEVELAARYGDFDQVVFSGVLEIED